MRGKKREETGRNGKTKAQRTTRQHTETGKTAKEMMRHTQDAVEIGQKRLGRRGGVKGGGKKVIAREGKKEKTKWANRGGKKWEGTAKSERGTAKEERRDHGGGGVGREACQGREKVNKMDGKSIQQRLAGATNGGEKERPREHGHQRRPKSEEGGGRPGKKTNGRKEPGKTPKR